MKKRRPKKSSSPATGAGKAAPPRMVVWNGKRMTEDERERELAAMWERADDVLMSPLGEDEKKL